MNERIKRETKEKCRRNSNKPLPASMSTLRRQIAGNHVLKGFYPLVVGIVNVKEKVRRRSNMRQLRSETLEEINDTSIEQERRTSEKSHDLAETQSITTSSMLEFSSDIAIGVAVGASFFVTAEASIDFNIGLMSATQDSSTHTITKSIKFTMPSQTVKCPPRKKVEMTWNFLSFTDTIHYLVDYELDPHKSFFKADAEFSFDFYHNFFNFDRNRARLSAHEDCYQLKLFNYTIPDSTTPDEITLLNSNGTYLLKNVPLAVRIDGHHGQFTTREKDL